MTEKTARHLNDLLARASAKARVPTLDHATGRTQFHRAVVGEFFAAIERSTPEAIAREISAAASARRVADVSISHDTYESAGYIEVRGNAHKIAYELAMPEMQAIADRYNASTLAEYETYRVACEQRVAIPPAESETEPPR